MDLIRLANLLFPHSRDTIDYYEKIYPQRNLKQGAKVTRIAPSPTGFIHLGNLYSAIINEQLARSSGGIFFLRIDDTDENRKIPGAIETIYRTLKYFGLTFDEGVYSNEDVGNYGPYQQRQRISIYHCFVKWLVEKGFAYPCFCTKNNLEKMREEQKQKGANIGYYGDWAIHRNLTLEEIENRISRNEKFVVRFRSNGDEKNTVNLNDAIRGKITLQENYQDFIILKSDGVPTYHSAHVIDDYLMRTTHVVRGEEWLASAPMHIQLFETFGWETPVYCHTAQLMKIDGNSKRKLSKRKDIESSLEFYISEGYLPSAVREYLMVLLNSNFEEWRRSNKDKSINEFTMSTNRMSRSGALYDIKKLNDISKNLISDLSIEEIYEGLKTWAQNYDQDFFEILTRDQKFSLEAIRVCTADFRKDFIFWGQVKNYLSFFYNELFKVTDEFPTNIPAEDSITFLKRFTSEFKVEDDKLMWLEKVKLIAVDLGYSTNIKKFREFPNRYKGYIGNLLAVLRITITGKIHSPDLWSICQVIGYENTCNRALIQIKLLQKNSIIKDN